jgi:hypothetical protein
MKRSYFPKVILLTEGTSAKAAARAFTEIMTLLIRI